MNLEKFLNERRLKRHETSPGEIENLFRIVDRDVKDASVKQLSPDRRFITAYNAALQLATILLRAFGYRTSSTRGGHHWTTFAILPDILGDAGNEYANYFEVCRIKRNISDYDSSGEISITEAEELVTEIINFKTIVKSWLEENYESLSS